MILLQGSQLERRFGADVLFSNINMTIQDNSRIALVGRNGAGKSTLLKILAGIEAPDEGTISKNRQAHIAYMDQHATLDESADSRTIFEEMASVFAETRELLKKSETLAMQVAELAENPNSAEFQAVMQSYDRIQNELQARGAYSYESEIRMVLSGFQFPESEWNKAITELSGGQRTRLALAKVLLEKREILILDEPTNHLDIETLMWLENYLPSYPGALLVISHDRYFLDHVTNETYEMTGGRLEYYAGNYSFYLKERQVRLESAERAFEKQQKKIAKLEDYVQRNIVRASTTKMAQSRRKQLEKMDRLKKPQQDERAPFIRFAADEESGNVVLTADHLGIGYDGKEVAYPISIDLRKQNALAIVGPNGVGKSTLLKTLIKEIPPIRGDFTYGANVHIGYYDQELGNLHSKKDVLHEIWDDHPTMTEQAVRSLLGSFLFSGQDVEKSVASLSGGEKARLELAKLSLNHDNLLLMDEPTNHLDIDSKEVLENALIEYNGTILFVSHDRYFINRIATAVIEIAPDGSTLYLGDYDYYLHKKREQEERSAAMREEGPEEATPVAPISSDKANYIANKAEQRTRRKLQREVDQLEEEIEALDTNIARIEQEMLNPKYLNDPGALNDLNKQLLDAKATQATAMTNWEEKALELAEYDD
ncbi:MAG: ABC-F family ATP-binding cassette domain-containing protein [Aerococcus sp.]|nr:ABC-F family ATP-binding cassette domain-containing protein [Aerococcus sp.]